MPNLIVDNIGDETSDRATITLTGTGGTPSIVNTSQGNGFILWNTTLAAAAVRIIDLHNHTVVDGSSVDRGSEIAASSTWFELVPGDNTLTITGVTASVGMRPAYS